jgi:hypothetical protein
VKGLLVVVFVALLAAGDDGYARETEPTEEQMERYNTLSIDIGRLGVINDSIVEAWKKRRADENQKSRYDPAELSSWLRAEVWHYNGLRESLCNDRYLVNASCGKPYLPAWIRESSVNTPSDRVLEQRQGELSDQIVRLWDAVCDDLKKRVPEEDAREFCSIE